MPGSEFTKGFKLIVFRIPDLKDSQYLRLRGTNLPPRTPKETDANGDPLADLVTNVVAVAERAPFAGIPMTATRRASSQDPVHDSGHQRSADHGDLHRNRIDGCPVHLPVVNGQKMSAFDVAAWSDLWFYSNPIYVEVQGWTRVAGVK